MSNESHHVPDEGPELEPNIIQGHNYDGIKEYDNPMPGWWSGLFWVGVIFAPIYIVGLHYSDWINSYEEDLAASMEELQSTRAAFAQDSPGTALDDSALLALAEDPAAVSAGQQLFAAHCQA